MNRIIEFHPGDFDRIAGGPKITKNPYNRAFLYAGWIGQGFMAIPGFITSSVKLFQE